MPKCDTDHCGCLENCLVGSALDGMSVGLIVMNAAGRVVWMNRSAGEILGLRKPDCYGQLLSQLLKDPKMAAFWHSARDVDGAVLGEVDIRWPQTSQLKTNAATCVNYEGNQIGKALLFCNVTHERAAQVELSQEVTQTLLNLAGSRDAPEPNAGLTPQELRVLGRVGAGLGNQAIADEINVAPSTVRSHLKHIYAKLGLTSRSEAISYALRNGIS